MALGNQSNKIYLSISDGKIVRRVAEGAAGAEARTKKDGTITWEQRFSHISGYIKSIGIKTSIYAGQEMKDWVFEIEDQGEAYTLQVMYSSRYATSLLFALCNPVVDFSKPITITPWMKIVDDKKKTSCYVKQGETDIDWYFTKDEQHGMPPMVETMFKGKKVWDDYDRMQFLEKFVEENVKPKLKANAVHLQTDKDPAFVPDTEPGYSADQLPEDDSLPF